MGPTFCNTILVEDVVNGEETFCNIILVMVLCLVQVLQKDKSFSSKEAKVRHVLYVVKLD